MDIRVEMKSLKKIYAHANKYYNGKLNKIDIYRDYICIGYIVFKDEHLCKERNLVELYEIELLSGYTSKEVLSAIFKSLRDNRINIAISYNNPAIRFYEDILNGVLLINSVKYAVDAEDTYVIHLDVIKGLEYVQEVEERLEEFIADTSITRKTSIINTCVNSTKLSNLRLELSDDNEPALTDGKFWLMTWRGGELGLYYNLNKNESAGACTFCPLDVRTAFIIMYQKVVKPQLDDIGSSTCITEMSKCVPKLNNKTFIIQGTVGLLKGAIISALVQMKMVVELSNEDLELIDNYVEKLIVYLNLGVDTVTVFYQELIKYMKSDGYIL